MPVRQDQRKTAMTNAERMRKYREKLKQEGKYEEVKRKDRERHRQRKNRRKSEQQLERERKLAAIRGKRYREKLKLMGVVKQIPTIKTRNEKEKMRKYWREKK